MKSFSTLRDTQRGSLFLKTMVCFSGCLMSSASLQKLFCGVFSVLKCSFEEFVKEKVVFTSYSSALLGPPPAFCVLIVIGALNRGSALCAAWRTARCGQPQASTQCCSRSPEPPHLAELKLHHEVGLLGQTLIPVCSSRNCRLALQSGGAISHAHPQCHGFRFLHCLITSC